MTDMQELKAIGKNLPGIQYFLGFDDFDNPKQQWICHPNPGRAYPLVPIGISEQNTGKPGCRAVPGSPFYLGIGLEELDQLYRLFQSIGEPPESDRIEGFQYPPVNLDVSDSFTIFPLPKFNRNSIGR